VHAAGELMPAFGVVDALQNGTIEMAQTAPYYFTGKDPIFAFGCAVPFGLTARQMDAWMEHGNGRKLMDAFYAKYNIRASAPATPAPRWAAGTARRSRASPT
jgi:TRAP-type mannitol/chloroaromatic compound transport system substrate-binding protein